MGFQRPDVGVWVLVSRVVPCCITYDICARLSSEHYTINIDSTVAMVIDMLVLINEPPEKLRNSAEALLRNIITVTVLRPFFCCTVCRTVFVQYRI